MDRDLATILLVDDQQANLVALEAVLSPLGQRLVKATSGRDALRFLLHEECALILLDVQMPDLDGFETAALIRERQRSRYTPIIFVTAIHREEEHILKGYSHGAVDYILKPFNPDALVTKVRVFLEQYQREQGLKRNAALRAQERDELHHREQDARADAEMQRERLHALFMQAPAAIAILKGPNHLFELANPRYEQLVGRSPLAGRPCREALLELAGQGLCDILDRVFRTGEPFLGRERGVRLRMDGGQIQERFFDFIAQPTRDLQGNIDGVLVHAVDVTESVLARRKLQDADRSKDEFLAMLGHELRNPLAPILTALQLMRLRHNAEGADRERAVIERQVNHLSRLVDDLLDVSRATTGKIELHRESVELATAVARAVEVARPLMDSKHHALTVSVPEHGLLVDGDVVRLAQVFANLLNNAAKYTDPGGHIKVEGVREGPDAVIRVRDDGRGIPPDRLATMFDLFVQGEQALDRAEGGLGVGLTLVRRLVSLHGGNVDAHSAGDGRGSEFIVHLPALSRHEERAEKTGLPQGTKANRSQRILVVDDNADAADTLAEALRFAGHEVREERDGRSALAALSEFSPDVVLLDLGLPGLDGFEVARRLRQDPKLTKIRVVAITGYGQEGDRQRTAAVGIDHHLVKPVDLDKVFEAIGT
jgi:signal transduction histidine kinase/CheY-like chemotaxis protein